MFCLTFHSIFHLHAVLLLISQSFQCFIWGRWAENSICHFSLFTFPFFWFVSTLCLAFYSILHLHAVLLLISRSFQCMVWGRWAENSLCHFSLFAFSGLFLHFGLPHILSFICMPFFWSSADHSNASSRVDEQKIASAAFRFSLFAFSGLFQHLFCCSAHQHHLLVCRIAMGLKDTLGAGWLQHHLGTLTWDIKGKELWTVYHFAKRSVHFNFCYPMIQA